MAFTRAQAIELLNKSEMQLYEDSRANALRGFTRTALAGRVERARAARDRARDLLKRQRLAARQRGEGKAAGAGGIAARTARKEALLADILLRFTDARRAAPVASARKSPARKSAAKAPAAVAKGPARRAPAKQAGTAKVAARKAAAGKAPAKKAPARKAPARKASTSKTAARATTGGAAGRAPARKTAPGKSARRSLSPERALANTRQLLEAKHERDRTPQPWQSLDPVTDHVPQPGYQSPQAASKAQELHAGESRMSSIHGSMATRDRRNQGKRDHRGDSD